MWLFFILERWAGFYVDCILFDGNKNPPLDVFHMHHLRILRFHALVSVVHFHHLWVLTFLKSLCSDKYWDEWHSAITSAARLLSRTCLSISAILTTASYCPYFLLPIAPVLPLIKTYLGSLLCLCWFSSLSRNQNVTCKINVLFILPFSNKLLFLSA